MSACSEAAWEQLMEDDNQKKDGRASTWGLSTLLVTVTPQNPAPLGSAGKIGKPGLLGHFLRPHPLWQAADAGA